MRSSCTYKISGTKTFRLSSSKILGRWGENLQNKEKSMRSMYIPDDGKIFVQVDCAGAEALIVAYLCEKGNLRDLFINGIKIHTYVALHLFKDIWVKKLREHSMMISEGFDIDEMIATPINKLKQHPDWAQVNNIIKASDDWSLQERYYYLAKQTAHSSNYGIEAPTFRMNILEKSGGKIVIKKEESERFLRTYHSLFPEIKDWHSKLRRQVEMTNMLFNCHGHPYIITAYNLLESAWKELYSWIPQSTVGMITNIAYVNMQHHIESNNLAWDLLGNCHDSYLLQCNIGEELECARIAQRFLEQEFTSPIDGAKFRMGSEAKCGYNWSNFKKETNELGLKDL